MTWIPSSKSYWQLKHCEITEMTVTKSVLAENVTWSCDQQMAHNRNHFFTFNIVSDE